MSSKVESADLKNSLKRGDEAQAKGHLDDAITSYLAAVERWPDRAEPHIKLALAFKKKGALSDSIISFQSALSADPHNIEILDAIGVMQQLNNDDAAAVKTYQKVLEVQPSRIKTLRNMALAFDKIREPHTALRIFQKILELDPNDTKAKGGIAKILATEQGAGLLVVESGGAELAAFGAEEFARSRPDACIWQAGPTELPAISDIQNLTDGSRIARGTHHGLTMHVFRVQQASCIWPGIVITKKTLITASNGFGPLETIVHNPASHPLRLDTNGERARIVLTYPPDAVEISGAVGVLNAIDNYSSWLLGELPRAVAYERAHPDLKLVIHGSLRRHHLETLAFYGIDETRLISVQRDKEIKARELHFATPTYFHHNVAYEMIDALRQGFLARQSLGHAQIRKSIYVSRSQLGGDHDRRIENELDVENFLAANGFQIVHPQLLSFQEQAEIFASAKRIVAPYGAALANTIFCDPDVILCVIFTKNTQEFWRLGHWLNLRTYAVLGTPRKIRDTEVASRDYVFTVDMNDLKRFLAASS